MTLALLIFEHCKGEHLKFLSCELAVEKPVDQVDLDAAVASFIILQNTNLGAVLLA